MSKKNIILTITGPSLTGKSIFSELLHPFNFKEIVSETTRPIRTGEVEGKTYNYITHCEFNAKIKKGEMLQHNKVDSNIYGVSYDSYQKISSKNLDSYVVVAPSGAKQIKDYCDNHDIICHQIFINNNLELRINRFLDRFKNDLKATPENYANRLINMLKVEEEDWVNKANTGQDKYDQVFDNFDNNNQNKVLSDLMKAIEIKKDVNFINPLTIKASRNNKRLM